MVEPMNGAPKRIVCLTPETTEFLYRIGAADRVVGVSSLAAPAPDGVERPVVSAFTTFRYELIESLEPDLILAFSDLQADAARELGQKGYPVFLTNQRTITETLDTMLMLGRLVGQEEAARELIGELQGQLDAARNEADQYSARPVVYFEEWFDPLITGIHWAGELIEAAGGRDAFPELAKLPSATLRIVAPEAVIERQPDIIIASWCGKPVRFDHILGRPGWDRIPAIQNGALHEVDSAHCLQPGLRLFTEGLPRFQAIVRQWRKNAATALLSG